MNAKAATLAALSEALGQITSDVLGNANTYRGWTCVRSALLDGWEAWKDEHHIAAGTLPDLRDDIDEREDEDWNRDFTDDPTDDTFGGNETLWPIEQETE